MNKVWKIFQYGYLIVASLFVIDAIFTLHSNKKQAFIKIGIAIFISFIFFVKRKFRKKIQQRNNQNN